MEFFPFLKNPENKDGGGEVLKVVELVVSLLFFYVDNTTWLEHGPLHLSIYLSTHTTTTTTTASSALFFLFLFPCSLSSLFTASTFFTISVHSHSQDHPIPILESQKKKLNLKVTVSETFIIIFSSFSSFSTFLSHSLCPCPWLLSRTPSKICSW